MDNPHTTPSLKDAVLQQIEDGSVTMEPQWKFRATSVLTVLCIAGFFFIALFLATFMVFALVESGSFALPGFGLEGLRGFFFAFPWVSLSLALAFGLLLVVLILRYGIAYRQPVVYTVLLVAASLMLGTVLGALAKVHEHVYALSQEKQGAALRPLYHSAVAPELSYLHRGLVAEVKDTGFLLREREGGVLTIIVTEETRFVPPTPVHVGDMVIVFGEAHEDGIEARGVRRGVHNERKR